MTGQAQGWRLEHEQRDELPRLAWVAQVDHRERCVRVWHGGRVECRPEWCVEGVWEGDFERGEFHEVENFFGSGVRLHAGGVAFASSVAPVDRLVHVAWRGKHYVSNSLVQLLARTGARLRLDHDYAQETFASRSGIHAYPSGVRVAHADFDTVHQDYHCNLAVVDGSLVRATRSQPRRFASYEDYCASLTSVLARLRQNQASPARRHALAAFTTTSGGYDSSAVTALARDAGIDQAFTTQVDRSLHERHQESGAEVIRALGLKAHELSSSPATVSELERWFLAGSIDGSEIVYHDLARHVQARGGAAVVLTGYYGDVVWSRHPPPFADDIRRKDVSGLGLTEVRLVAGLVHVPVPVIHARAIADLVALSNSGGMQPWSVGGDYDRPIPRRIAESAGVPREAFGRVKRVQLLYYNEPMNASLRRDFFAHVTAGLGMSRLGLAVEDALREADQRLAALRRSRPWLAERVRNRRSLMYVWAVNSLAEQSRSAYDASAAIA